MSLGRPPTTVYGDTDFIKDDYNPQQTTFAPPGASQPPINQGGDPTQSASPYTQISPYKQSPVGQQAVNSGFTQTSSSYPQTPNPVIATAQSMTHEDMLFMRSWRQDTFYYRVLPISAFINGTYFYYNKTKGLPHKLSRYFVLTGLSYFAGVLASKGDLSRRVNESESNTQFMQNMKRLLGATSRYSEFQTATNRLSDTSAEWATTGDGFSRRPFPHPSQPSYAGTESDSTINYQNDFRQSDAYRGGYDVGTLTSESAQNEGQRSVATSYEELRARNRGMVSPKQL